VPRRLFQNVIIPLEVMRPDVFPVHLVLLRGLDQLGIFLQGRSLHLDHGMALGQEPLPALARVFVEREQARCCSRHSSVVELSLTKCLIGNARPGDTSSV